MKIVTHMPALKYIAVMTVLLFAGLSMLMAQEKPPDKGPSDEDLAKANNPLADIRAFNLQNTYTPRLFGVDDAVANVFWLRYAMPTGRVLWRASLPLQTVSSSGYSNSGLGDFDLFAAYLAIQKPEFSFGLGPALGIPTATDDELGTEKWSAGLAVVAFAVPSPQLQLGALVTWRASFAGEDAREDLNLLAFQPFYFWQLGQGTYLRGAPTWAFNLESGDFNVPVGFGIGKVIKIGNTVYNIFIEPQYTVLHEGVGQPAFQIFSSLNLQFTGNN